MASTKNGKSQTPSEWVGFPSSSFLNPFPSPFKFTNPLSKRVLLIADEKYVSKHVATYLETTLTVSGIKVTKYTSVSSSPLFWTKAKEKEKDTNEQSEVKDNEEDNTKSNDAFWEYNLNLSEFDCILIPSQIHSDLWSDITQETKTKIQNFVKKGGCLVCCHFRATNFINGVCGCSWHEISVKIGTSYHAKKENDSLIYKDDVRGIININKEDIIYKTKDDFTTVGFKKYGDGYAYYIGHDFTEIWARDWNKILYNAIKKTLSNSDQEIMNLSFGDIDIEAFKNLNIETNNGDKEEKDVNMDDFEPDFDSFNANKGNKNVADDDQKDMNEHNDDALKKSFDEFDELNDFDEEEVISPRTASEFASIGYVQMDDDGVMKINDNLQFVVEFDDENVEVMDVAKNVKVLQKIDENQEIEDDNDDVDDGNDSFEEVD